MGKRALTFFFLPSVAAASSVQVRQSWFAEQLDGDGFSSHWNMAGSDDDVDGHATLSSSYSDSSESDAEQLLTCGDGTRTSPGRRRSRGCRRRPPPLGASRDPP
jgi:hypothetical protein